MSLEGRGGLPSQQRMYLGSVNMPVLDVRIAIYVLFRSEVFDARTFTFKRS
jgi:hypothetical protein